MEHIQLDLCTWRGRSIEAGDTDCTQLEDLDVGVPLEDLQPYMVV